MAMYFFPSSGRSNTLLRNIHRCGINLERIKHTPRRIEGEGLDDVVQGARQRRTGTGEAVQPEAKGQHQDHIAGGHRHAPISPRTYHSGRRGVKHG